MAYRNVNLFSSHSLGAGGRAYIYSRHIFRWCNFKVKMLVSTPFFQGLSICILVRCSLQQITNYLLIFTSFSWCKRAIYSRNSSLWPLRSRKLTGWLKSPEICRGRSGVEGLPLQKKLRNSAEWFIFGVFLTLLFQTWIYIRAAYYGLKCGWVTSVGPSLTPTVLIWKLSLCYCILISMLLCILIDFSDHPYGYSYFYGTNSSTVLRLTVHDY